MVHCNGPAKVRLEALKPKTKFVCFKHFTYDFEGHYNDPKEVVPFILTEHCEPAYMKELKNRTLTRGRKREAEPLDSVDEPSPKNLSHSQSPLAVSPIFSIEPTRKRVSSQEKATEFSKQAHSLAERIESLVQEVGANDSDNQEELLRHYIISSKIGRSLIMGAMMGVIENEVDLLSAWDSRHLLLHALFRSFEQLSLDPSLIEISRRTGVGRNTVSKARDEYEEVCWMFQGPSV